MAETPTNNCDSQIVVDLLLSSNYQNPSSTPLAQSITEALKQDQHSLSGQHYATLMWVEEFYSDLLKHCGFNANLGDQLLRLTPGLAVNIITDSQFLTPPQHPLHAFYNQLCAICIGWHQDLGRTGQAFVKQIETLVDNIINQLSSDTTNHDALTAILAQFEDSINTRAEKLEKRAIEAETGKLKAKHAKAFVAKALNEQLQPVQLPQPVLHLLQTSWYESLQLVYLRYGSDSAQWSAMNELADKLIWTLQPVETQSEEHTQRLYKEIPQITRQFRKNLLSIQHDNSAITNAISIIEEQHFKVLKGQAVEYESYQPLSVGSLLGNTIISSSLLDAIDQQQVGQWYSLSPDNKRIKLALKAEQQRQLLFVNQAGLAALDRSYEEFAYLLTSGDIKPLDFSTVFTDSMASSLTITEINTDDNLTPAPDAEAIEDNGIPGNFSPGATVDVITALPVAEVEAISAESLPAAKMDSQIPLGSWVRFLDKDQIIEARLVACLGGDRHIFVNQAGIRQREISSQELTDLTEKNLFQITDVVSDFAHSVQIMINKLRGSDNEGIERE